MDTLSQLVAAVRDDLTVGEESSLYHETSIVLSLNRAKRKAEALFPWPELQDAKKTTTQSNFNYYDYPQTWRSNSIWKLTVTNSSGEEERYGEDPDGSPLTFDDFLNWKEDYPDSTDKKWANQERRYFISPTPTFTGNLNTGIGVISVWGIMTTEDLSEDADTTIFSYSMPEGNEAIVLEAVAILKAKGENEKSSEFKSLEAKQILAVAWQRIIKEKAKYEKDQPFFEVPDFFSKNGGVNRDMRGLF